MKSPLKVTNILLLTSAIIHILDPKYYHGCRIYYGTNMRLGIQAAVVTLLVTTGIPGNCQAPPTCPVSIRLLNVTQDRIKIHVLAHHTKSPGRNAKLFLAIYIVDEENHRWLEGGEILSNWSYTSTDVWNNRKLQEGKLILRVEKIQLGSNALPTPVDGCNSIERNLRFQRW